VDAAPYLSPEQKARIRQWTGEGIVRASIGLEDAADLIADLDHALNARTVKGFVGPAAYRAIKKLDKYGVWQCKIMGDRQSANS